MYPVSGSPISKDSLRGLSRQRSAISTHNTESILSWSAFCGSSILPASRHHAAVSSQPSAWKYRGGFRYTRPVVFAEGFSTIRVVLRSCQSPEEPGVLATREREQERPPSDTASWSLTEPALGLFKGGSECIKKTPDQAKDQMKRRGLRSCDLADALATTFYASGVMGAGAATFELMRREYEQRKRAAS